MHLGKSLFHVGKTVIETRNLLSTISSQRGREKESRGELLLLTLRSVSVNSLLLFVNEGESGETLIKA